MKNIYLFFIVLSSSMICAGDGMVISEDGKATFLSRCSKERIVEALQYYSCLATTGVFQISPCIGKTVLRRNDTF